MTWDGTMTLGDIVAARTTEAPEKVFIHFEDRSVTYGMLDQSSNRFANHLLSLGLSKGDKVAIMLDNSPEFLAAWVGTAKGGFVEVPINTGYKGDLLAYLLDQAEVQAIVLDARWLDRLTEIAGEVATLQHVILVDQNRGAPTEPGSASNHQTTGIAADSQVHDFEAFLSAGDAAAPPVQVHPFDTAVILFTAGTTGPSKGAVRSHRANFSIAQATIALMDYQPGEVFFTVFPMFHVNAKTNTVIPALILDGTVVMRSRFHASTFWDTCRRHEVTAFNYMGALLMMLHKQPPRSSDADNPVQKAYGAPAPLEIFEDFQTRFGVKLVEVYGSTECGIVTYNTIHEMRLGSCGKAAPYYEVELHDEGDEPCPPGVPGEIVVRPREPYIMFTEYYRNPQATKQAFRNLWFHTGDRALMDEDGYFRYLDRIKDSIRRRGENISSWEVERVINSLPAVQESAVIGVPSELTEEEVLAVVVPKPGQDLAPETILDEVGRRMPHFAVPRYVRLVDELPKNPAQRIQKFQLRAEGLTKDTWDREEHDYEVQR
jgi:crotonobetaine/carnitine-CoA ligase